MKLLKFSFLAILSTFSVAQAGPLVSGGGVGDRTQYISCKSEELNFEIRGTAIPTFKQGILLTRDNEFVAQLKCQRTHSDIAPGHPSAGQVLWSCQEYPTHDGNFLVRVETGGFTGLTTAYVFQKQIYPLEPQAIATLNCSR